MEIKTCEQYVLAEIEKKNAEIERLKDQVVSLEEINFNQSLAIGELTAKAKELQEVFERLLGLVNRDDEKWANYYTLSVSDMSRQEDFEFIDGLKKEREPNSEENDSQNNV